MATVIGLAIVLTLVGLSIVGVLTNPTKRRPRRCYRDGPHFGVPIPQPPVPVVDKLPVTRTCCNSAVGGVHQFGCRFGPRGPSQAFWSNRR